VQLPYNSAWARSLTKVRKKHKKREKPSAYVQACRRGPCGVVFPKLSKLLNQEEA
jgi:hypothetical protein